MSVDLEALSRAYDELCEKLVWAERTAALLSAVDEHVWNEQPARVYKEFIRLSYGRGRLWVYLRTVRELAERLGMKEHHVAKAIEDLVDANALQVYKEHKRYEVLPDVGEWRTAARCCRGFKGGRELEADIVANDDRRRRQIEMGEVEITFNADTTTKEAVGQNSREKAGFPREEIFSAWTQTTAQPAVSQPSAPPPGADDRGGQADNHPSANTGAAKADGPLRLGEAVRRTFIKPPTGHEVVHNPPQKLTPEVSFGSEPKAAVPPKLTPEVSFGSKAPGATIPKLTPEVSFGRGSEPKLTPEVSFGPVNPAPSRAREKNPTTTATTSLPSSHSQRLPSVVADADGRCGDRGEKLLVMVDHSLFQDMHRFLGDLMGGFSTFWRAAIRHDEVAAYEAYAETKNSSHDHAGRFMRYVFYRVCAERGAKPFAHPELRRGIHHKLAHHWRNQGKGGESSAR